MEYRTKTMIDSFKYETTDFTKSHIYKRKSFSNDIVIKYADKVNPYYVIKNITLNEEQKVQLIPSIIKIYDIDNNYNHINFVLDNFFENISNDLLLKIIQCYFENDDFTKTFAFPYKLQRSISNIDINIFKMIIEKYKDKIEEKLDYITIADFIPVDFLKDYFDDIMIKYNKFNFVSSFYNYKFSIQTIIDNLDKIENNEYGIGINLLKKLLRNCCIQKNLCMLYEENKELGLEKMNIIKNQFNKMIKKYNISNTVFIEIKHYNLMNYPQLFQNEDKINFVMLRQ